MKLIKIVKPSILTSLLLAGVLFGVSATIVAATNSSSNGESNGHDTNQSSANGRNVTSEMMLHTTMNQVSIAQYSLEFMQKNGTPNQVKLALDVLKDTEIMLVSVISQISGVSSHEITNMHSSGLSWAEVAAKLEINSEEGGGKLNNDLDQERMNTTIDNGSANVTGVHHPENQNDVKESPDNGNDPRNDISPPGYYHHGPGMGGMH